MLNKLSFNIFNELNESETEKYKIKKKVLIESNGVKTINEDLSAKITFECNECGHVWDETFEDYFTDEDDLYEVLESGEMDCPNCGGNDVYYTDYDILNEEVKSICEKCGKEPCECKTLNEDNNEKEERLASLKIQLEKDGDQLADDEKEAIEKEIAELEKEVIKESSNPEADEKVGGDYNEFIEELQNFRQLMVDQVDVQSTKLASEIIMDTIEEYDDIIRNYERQKDIEIEGAMNESSLTEEYSEKLGGDPADFVSDVESIKATLEAIDTSSFGTHLAQQMVEDWIETCERQIQKGKRLASDDEFYSESSLAEDSIEDAKNDSIKKGLYSESSTSLRERFKKFLDNNVKNKDYNFDAYIDDLTTQYGNTGTLEYELSKSESKSGKPELFNYSEEDLKELGYNLEEAEEMQVKNLQVIKEQGNVYMLQDENKKMIVGENYNPDEGMIENAEVYENKDEADKDYLNRCEILKGGEKLKSNKNSDELNEGSLIETSYEYMSNKSGIPVEDLSKVVPKLIKKDKNFRDYATDYQIRIIKKELEKLKSKNK